MTDVSSENWKSIDAENTTGMPSAPEGCAPSSINDAIRATLGAIKRWFSRTNPTIISAGSANAQTLTYEVGPAEYTIGDVYRFTPAYTNTGAMTLAVAPLGDVSVLCHGQALIGGEVEENVIACVAYDATNNFQLLNPVGRIFGDLNVTGDLSVGGNETVVDITTSGDLIVGDDANVNGDFGVAGTTNLSGNVGIGGTLNVTGDTTLANTHITGQLSLDDDTILINGHPVTLLSENKFYYVATDGSDTTGDGTFDLPWASLSHAAAVIQSTTNFGSYTINLQLKPGVYDLTSTGFFAEAGRWEITSTTLSAPDVVVNVTGFQMSGFHALSGATVFVTNLTVSSTGGYCVAASGSGVMTFSNLIFGDGVAQIAAFDGGVVNCIGNYSISGNANSHIACSHGTVTASSSGTPITVTGTGPLVFDEFISCSGGGYVRCISGTYSSLSVTGLQYVVTSNGVIDSGGEAAATFLPPFDTSGTANTGGIFV